MNDKKITAATIGPMPRPMPEGMFDDMPSVTVTYEDGETEKLFTFYPDEISFTASEFQGKTREEALALRHKKDVGFIQS